MTDRDKPKKRGKNKGNVSEITNNAFTENKEYLQKYPKNIIEISNASQVGKVHPTQKPIDLIKNIIKDYSEKNELILDCYFGSGTTVVACKELGRQYIGFEIDPEYYQIAVDRLNGVSQQEKRDKANGVMDIFDFMGEDND